jgi:hypothetical protein
VHRTVDGEQPTGVAEPLEPAWKIAAASNH